jgi:hypothetical protein
MDVERQQLTNRTYRVVQFVNVRGRATIELSDVIDPLAVDDAHHGALPLEDELPLRITLQPLPDPVSWCSAVLPTEILQLT